jgi:hypothetical protein
MHIGLGLADPRNWVDAPSITFANTRKEKHEHCSTWKKNKIEQAQQISGKPGASIIGPGNLSRES